MHLPGLLEFWDYLGTFVFCVSGAIAGRQHEMDWFGIFVIALVTGTGGSLLRSMMLGDFPPVVLTNPVYFMLAVSAVLVALHGANSWQKVTRIISVLDALGLGIFLVTGMRIAQTYGLAGWACIAIGVVSATFGGLLRDVLRNEVPLVLRKEIYATACIMGGLALLGFDYANLNEIASLVLTSLIVVAIRLIAIRYAIHLPR
jgi:uncharacterized membrane protein YeiH